MEFAGVDAGENILVGLDPSGPWPNADPAIPAQSQAVRSNIPVRSLRLIGLLQLRRRRAKFTKAPAVFCIEARNDGKKNLGRDAGMEVWPTSRTNLDPAFPGCTLTHRPNPSQTRICQHLSKVSVAEPDAITHQPWPPDCLLWLCLPAVPVANRAAPLGTPGCCRKSTLSPDYPPKPESSAADQWRCWGQPT